MTINTISQTITSALEAKGAGRHNIPAEFAPYVEAVEAALLERDYTITETVVNVVSTNFGMGAEQLEEHAERFGLSVRPQPEPEVEEEEEEEADQEEDGLTAPEGASQFEVQVVDTMNRMTGILERLVNAAQKNGIEL